MVFFVLERVKNKTKNQIEFFFDPKNLFHKNTLTPITR